MANDTSSLMSRKRGGSNNKHNKKKSANKNTQNNKHHADGTEFLEAAMDDTMVADELNQLSLEEREIAMAELHGVADIPAEEAPDRLEVLLKNILEEIAKLPKSNKERRAWDRAVFLRPSLLHDKEFLTMFLRADRYDPASTARRLCKHFHYKLELFGEERLVRPITMDDLNEDDIDVFRSGFFQILPKTDTVGRSVACCILRLAKYKHWTNLVSFGRTLIIIFSGVLFVFGHVVSYCPPLAFTLP